MSKSIAHTQSRRREFYPIQICILACDAQTLKDNTLGLLKQHHIPTDNIHVFVKTNSLQQQFKKLLKAGTYASLRSCEENNSCIHTARNTFPVGTPLVFLTDRIRDVIERVAVDPGKPKSMIKTKSLLKILKDGFSQCQQEGSHCWGIAPRIQDLGRKGALECPTVPSPHLWGELNEGGAVHTTRWDCVGELERSFAESSSGRRMALLRNVGVIVRSSESVKAERQKVLRQFAAICPALGFGCHTDTAGGFTRKREEREEALVP